MNKKGEFECVLPESGKFARIRRMSWRDVMTAFAAKENVMPVLASLICTLDDESMTPEQWLEADYEDIAPVINEINRRFQAISNSRGTA